mgnify:CR=1 FL=1
MKLLGVVINKDLKWDKNTRYLVKKANKKMRMLHIAAKFTRNREHLMQIYKTFIRSNLEFSSNVWHSSLTKENRQDLERVQKAALKVILGKDYKDYDDALKLSKLQSLEQRREVISLRSTIPYLQRQLNRDVLKRKCEFKDLQTFNEVKKVRTENNNHSELVNYVSFADPIT